ncbi:MAG: 4Fe-4S binding protein [Candidatus Competibacter denitrificans]
MPEAAQSAVLSLSRLRLGVQLLMLALTVWGGALVGHYAAEKISSALPSLSCAYDQSNGAYCVLIPLQHQMHHRVGELIQQTGQFTLSLLLPLVFTVAAFYAFYFFIGKAFCGWICPLGTVQEWLYRLGRVLRRPFRHLSERAARRLRPLKWLVLLVLVLGLPLAAGLGVTPHATGDAFCQVCPSRLATTLLTGDAEQAAIRTGGILDFAFGALANTLFGFVLIASLAVRQPFCRICPLLALNAAFQRLSPLRLVKQAHDRCEKCGICTKACPMDIPEIWHESGQKAFNEDCTLCGRCAEFCPDDDIIQIKFGPARWFGSSRAYYKARIKQENPQGEPKIVRWLPPRTGGHG